MKIEQIEVFGVAVPLVGEFTTAYKSKSVQRSVVVRITGSDGTIGLGNVDPVAGYSAETVEETLQVLKSTFGPQLIGMNPTNINALLARLEAIVPEFLDAKAAIEMTCIDL